MKNINKIFSAVLLFFIVSHCTLNINNCKAQWVQTNGIYGGTVHSLAISGVKYLSGQKMAFLFLPITAQAGLRQRFLSDQYTL